MRDETKSKRKLARCQELLRGPDWATDVEKRCSLASDNPSGVSMLRCRTRARLNQEGTRCALQPVQAAPVSVICLYRDSGQYGPSCGCTAEEFWELLGAFFGLSRIRRRCQSKRQRTSTANSTRIPLRTCNSLSDVSNFVKFSRIRAMNAETVSWNSAPTVSPALVLRSCDYVVANPMSVLRGRRVVVAGGAAA